MHQLKLKKTVVVPSGQVALKGDLWIPQESFAMVIFVHGSGSSRLSPRNQMVATYLNKQGIATFLFDLLTLNEDKEYPNRFNITLLCERLMDVTKWVTTQKESSNLKFGFFGASTGAAAALIASTELPEIAAVVSRGGRPDLAKESLPLVKAPTLLIVGGFDKDVIELNQHALNDMHCEKKLEIVPEATHLFEEKGAMEHVCVLAANWFDMHLQPLGLLNKTK